MAESETTTVHVTGSEQSAGAEGGHDAAWLGLVGGCVPLGLAAEVVLTARFSSAVVLRQQALAQADVVGRDRVHATYTWKRERVRHVVLDPAKLR